MSKTFVVETENLTKTFFKNEVIRNCNMHVQKNTIYGFLGANGAGKTTIATLNMGVFCVLSAVMYSKFIMAFIAGSIGIIAIGIGFIKKSVPITIVSSVLIASLMSNIVTNIAINRIVIYLFAAAMILIGIIFSTILIKKVDIMEVE